MPGIEQALQQLQALEVPFCVASSGDHTKMRTTLGITGLLPVGAEAVKGEPLAIIHARSRNAAEKAERELRAAYSIGSSKPAAQKAVIRRIAPTG